MKVDAIRADYGAKIFERLNNSAGNSTGIAKQNGFSTISFRSGNSKHLFHQISELSMFGLGSGGVGTVGNDLFFNTEGFDRVIENIPLYNQEVIYKKEMQNGKVTGVKQDGIKLRRIPEGLSANHPFKSYEGKVFITPIELGKGVDLAKELAKPQNYNKVFVLDEISSSKMSWGLENEVPISNYILRKDDKVIKFLRSKGWNDEMIKKIDITFTYVDSTASMKKPYADGSYATATGEKAVRDMSCNWQGKPYPKEAKATAELLPALKEKLGFDPKFIVCHDGQAMPLIHYVAELNANGGDYWKDKVVTAYGHNLNDGYMYGLGTKDAIVALAKKGELEKIINSKEYIEALRLNREDEFLKSLLPKEILDGRGQCNAVMFPIAYGEKGYLPMFTTVSNHYYKSIVENELVSPALYERLKELDEKGIFRGIINVLMDPQVSGFTTDGLQNYHKNACKIKLKDGKEIEFAPFKAFEESKKYDLSHIREIKQHNKITLLKRLKKEFEGAQLWGAGTDGTMQWLDAGTGYSAAVTGGTGRKFKILGGIDDKFIKMLESGKDVPTFISWGRGDFQKGMDTGFEAWVKYVQKTKDTNSIYIFGGDMSNIKKDIQLLVDKYANDKDIAGRFICLDGWAPGVSFAAAGDYATLASRFAPCELTDLEAMKKCCVPIVPKVQGMDQKVFDPTDAEHFQFVNGYKGQHEYYMSEAEALKCAKEEHKTAFNEIKNEVVKELSKDYKYKTGENIPDYLLQKQLKGNEKYNEALQKLRNEIISDEMADSIERAIKDRNTDVASKMLKNHVDLKTTWMENGWCNPGGKSTGQLVKEMHYNSSYGKNLEKGQELKLDLSKLTSNKSNFGQKLNKFIHSKKGKWAIAGAAAAAIGGLGVLGYKNGWFSPDFNKEDDSKRLSCIV